MTDDRAVRYRRLAMRETDPGRAEVLRLLADEAEKGILHAPANKISAKPASVTVE
jgi:hypothetical protein